MTVIPFKSPENRGKPPPLFNIPPLTLYTLGVIVAVQAVFMIMPDSFVNVWGYRLAFVSLRYTDPQMFDVFALTSPFTHLFMHGGWLHLAMNGVMFVAFGSASERMLGAKRSAILFVVCGLAGALAQFALAPTSPIPMVGASGALSGLFAAVITRLQKSGAMPAGRFGIWGIAALWIGLSFLSGFVAGAMGPYNVAWAAHAGGFLAGILLMRLRYFS